MGIPHLRRQLEAYAERTVIEPCDVVLDGPALAYHVLNLCSRGTRSTSPFEQPSYDVLGRTAVAWLNKIQACGLSVAAIYFDSYLPSSKRPERLQRLLKCSRDLIKYHSSRLSGVPGIDHRRASDAQVELFPDSWPGDGSKKPKPPPPPFLVPAIIDALRCSPVYQHLVKLVPGEADVFCARHVRSKAGLVLTSDSDLLICDLGPDGGIVFFSDIDLDSERQRLISLQYRPVDICRRLSIKPETGLLYLAFEISNDPHLTLKQAVERSKRVEADATPREEYSEFIKQYISPEVATGFETDQALILDPRVSEIALRSVLSSDMWPSNDESTKSICIDTQLEMYLPFLLDCPSRVSSWEASKPLRQLAYSILQSAHGGEIPSVSEMRRLQSITTGVRVDVPSPLEIDKTASSLLALLSEIDAAISKPEVAWTVLSIYQDIVMTMDRARACPLSLELLEKEARGRLDTCSWEFLHFLAQTQATLYSLRMLRQILEFVAYNAGPLPPPTSELASFLSSVPPLPEFPYPRRFADTLRKVREEGGLSCLMSLCADFEDIVSLIKSVLRPEETKKTKKRKAASSMGESQSKSRSSNPFDLLDRDED